jgi:hypothetical protein
MGDISDQWSLAARTNAAIPNPLAIKHTNVHPDEAEAIPATREPIAPPRKKMPV